MQQWKRIPVAAGLVVAAILAASSSAAALDLDLYGALLSRHTVAVEDTAGTRVDYAGLRADPDWRRLVASLEESDPERLEAGAEHMAFWINAYNVLAMNWIVVRGPVASIRDLGSLFRPIWKRKAGQIGKRNVTLAEIEHGILRPLAEPRIHFAIVCASTSCPSLLREPFRATELERQLDDQARSFLADPRKGLAIDRRAEDVRLSKIFDWFSEDFGKAEGVMAFIVKYGPELERSWLQEYADEIDLLYLPYDWELNGQKGGS